jgi:CRISPR-associated endonuclease/helicase Cas3
MRGKYVRSFCEGADMEMPILEETPYYPLATHVPTRGKPETGLKTRREIKRTVSVTFIDELEDALNVIKDAVRKGQCACWVRNTVRDSRTVYNMLASQEWMDKTKLMLFHSRFAMVDRRNRHYRSVRQGLNCGKKAWPSTYRHPGCGAVA